MFQARKSPSPVGYGYAPGRREFYSGAEPGSPIWLGLPGGPGGRSKASKGSRVTLWLQLAAAVILTCYLGFIVGRMWPLPAPLVVSQPTVQQAPLTQSALSLNVGTARSGGSGGDGSGRPHTLVVYIFSNTDPEYYRNLVYFVEHGVSADDGCQYVFVVQEGAGSTPPERLPDLPPNAYYVRHNNICFDWGTIGWLMRTGQVAFSEYRYYIFMNSSVRGPFRPAYVKERGWVQIFTGMLSNEVKLVGPTISCEGAPLGGDPAASWRQNPHVQSYVIATDQRGLEVLQSNGQVFSCYGNLHDTIYFSELGASAAILEAGYNLGCLMARYQGIDWRDTRNWGCNGRLSPYAQGQYDGVSMDPYEAVFVKVKSFLLLHRWTAAIKGAKYDAWVTDQKPELQAARDVNANDWLVRLDEYRLPTSLFLQTLGGSCFDWQYYYDRNKDLAAYPPELLFHHFTFNGVFEGRPFRNYPNCQLDYSTALWKLMNNRLVVYDFSDQPEA